MSSRHQFPCSKFLIAVLITLWSCTFFFTAESGAVIPPATATLIGVPADEPGGSAVRLVLAHAEYEVDVLGSMALGTLVQEFRNDSREDLLATYSLRGATGLELKALEVEVDGVLQGGEAAAEEGMERTEGTPQASGPTTGSVSSAPTRNQILVSSGQVVTVRIGFEMTLPLDQGRFRLVLPAVAPDVDEEREKKASTVAPGFVPLDIPDAEREPDHLPALVPLSFNVNVHHPQPLLEVESTSHEIWTGYSGDRTLISLEEGESLSRRAFELSFSMGSESEATFVAYARPGGDGIQSLVAVLLPPTTPWRNIIRPKQVLFILDTSGSMRGVTFDQARDALTSCLEKMEPDDAYNVVEFDSDFTVLAPEPVKISAMPPHEARSWLDNLQADGGTALVPGLRAALRQPESEDHHRMIVIFSDGGLADEEEVLKLLEEELGSGRLFVVGIGKQVNQDAITKIAEKGRGTATFAPDRDSLAPVVARLFESVVAPLAWNLEIDMGDAPIEAIHPQKLPDLYAGRTVTAVARVSGQLPREISLQGVTTDGERTWTASVRTFEGKQLRTLPEPKEPADGERKRTPKSK